MNPDLEDMMKAFVAAAVRHLTFAAGVWLAGHEMIKVTDETNFSNMASGIVLGMLALAWSWWNKTGYQLVIGVVRKADLKNGSAPTVSPAPAAIAAAATATVILLLCFTAVHFVRPATAQVGELANRFGTIGEPVQSPAFGGVHLQGRPAVKSNPHFGTVAKAVVDTPPAAAIEPSAPFGAVNPVPNSHQFGPLSLAPVPLTGNPIADVKAAIAAPTPRPAMTGNPVADFYNAVSKLGKKLAVDLKTAYAYSIATNPDGTQVDPIAAPCQKALVPIIELVVNGPAPATSLGAMALTDEEKTIAAGGVVTELEKLRILRMSLQSSAMTVACGPLVQDEVKLAGNIVGGITTLITGGALLGL